MLGDWGRRWGQGSRCVRTDNPPASSLPLRLPSPVPLCTPFENSMVAVGHQPAWPSFAVGQGHLILKTPCQDDHVTHSLTPPNRHVLRPLTALRFRPACTCFPLQLCRGTAATPLAVCQPL